MNYRGSCHCVRQHNQEDDCDTLLIHGLPFVTNVTNRPFNARWQHNTEIVLRTSPPDPLFTLWRGGDERSEAGGG